MTVTPAQIEKALVAPCMDAVIAVTERYQFLEVYREARVFTAYREIDHVMHLGFNDNLSEQVLANLEERGFQLLEAREGTRREHRLLLLTLKEIGYSSRYEDSYFLASKGLLRHLRNLGWPLGSLTHLLNNNRISSDGPTS